jgi:hypothetical protein
MAGRRFTSNPALHYIAVTAQEHLEETTCTACACRSNKSIQYLGKTHRCFGFLDIQVAHSTVKTEVTELVKYLSLPQVHLGIDPEFS